MRITHANQVRRGSEIPYIHHLLGVASSLVIEFGGSEPPAIAGLLHDVLEDCDGRHEAIICAQWGDAVAYIVVACTDGNVESKAKPTDPEARRQDGQRRKQTCLDHLNHASEATLWVSACDRLHNARVIVQDLETLQVGVAVFDRSTDSREGTLGYYLSLLNTFATHNVHVDR